MLKICGGRLFFGVLAVLLSTSCAYAESPENFAHRKFDALQSFSDQLIKTLGSESFEGSVNRASSLYGIHADSSTENPTIEFHFSLLPAYDIRLSSNSLTVSFIDAIVLDDIEKMYIDGGALITSITATQSAVSPQYITKVTLTTNNSFSANIKDIGTSVRLTLMPPNTAQDRKSMDIQHSKAPNLIQSAIREYRLRHIASLSLITHEYAQISKQISADVELAKLKMLELELTQLSPASSTDHSGLISSLDTFNQRITTLHKAYNHDRMLYAQIIQKASSSKYLVENESVTNTIKLLVNKLDRSLLSMKTTVTHLQSNVETAHRQLSHSHQVVASFQVPNNPTNNLVSLDMAVAGIRNDPSKIQSSTFDTLELALDTVNIATPELDVPILSNAAIRHNEKGSITTPPAKRERPARHSLTSTSVRAPGKMSTLNASQDELTMANEQGMLILAQATSNSSTPEILTDDTRPEPESPESIAKRRRVVVKNSATDKPNFNLYNENMSPDDDPLRQLVNIDFKDMDLTNVVSLLAQKGQIDVIASVDLTGKVTANLSNIPLGRAIEVVLRMNELGIVEETGIYRITTYEEAVATRQDTEMIFLQSAEAKAVKETLDEIVNQGGSGGGADRVRIGVNTQSNIVIISGPRDRVNELVDIIEQIDIAEPIIPTINKSFKLNYANPTDMEEIIKEILSENGTATAEERSGQLVVTDIPVKIKEIGELIEKIDIPVEQVSIEAMVVDNFLSDGSEIGSTLLVSSDSGDPIDGTSKSFTSGTGPNLGDSSTVKDSNTDRIRTVLGQGGTIGFGFVHNKKVLLAKIQSQITSNDAMLLANPVVVTLENSEAQINITTDFPYEERTQSTDGGTTVSTAFKEVGTKLTVTPKITFDEQVIVDIKAEESTITGLNVAGIPISALRKAQTSMRMADGQTVYIAGLRRLTDTQTEAKVPILGDIPILGLLFKSTSTDTQNNELMIFLTCTIVEDSFSELTPYQKDKYDKLGGIDPEDINATQKMMKAYGKDQMRDPIYKWRRSK